MIDCAISPLALGTSQPATEVMAASFKGTAYDPCLNMDALHEVSEYFDRMRSSLIQSGRLNLKMLEININTLHYQVPGGMLSNLMAQLKEAGKEEYYSKVLEEIPYVRKDLGEPPLVTPSSQIVGTQALLNVLTGERYKIIPKEVQRLILGEYGSVVGEVNPEVRKKAVGRKTGISCRPADLIPDALPALRKKCGQWIMKDEDVLTYAMFPDVAESYFRSRVSH